MYDNSASGNASYGAGRRKKTRKQKVPVQVETQMREGIEFPCRITLRTMRTFQVDRVYGCKRDAATGDMEYMIRIGPHATRLWRRPDGSYYVIPK